MDLFTQCQRVKAGETDTLALVTSLKTWTPQQIGALTDLIESGANLRTLRIVGCDLGDENGAKIIEALCRNTTVENLSLDSNQLGEKSVVQLSALLSESLVLKSLELGGNHLIPPEYRTLLEGLKQNTTLEHLLLSSTSCTTKDRDPDKFDLRTSMVEVADEILSVITAHPGLKSISVPYNQLTSEIMGRFVTMAETHPTLERLNINTNMGGNVAGKAVAKAITRNPRLKQIYLHNAMVGEESLPEIATALSNNTSLAALTLSQQGTIGYDTIEEHFASAIHPGRHFNLCKLITNNSVGGDPMWEVLDRNYNAANAVVETWDKQGAKGLTALHAFSIAKRPNAVETVAFSKESWSGYHAVDLMAGCRKFLDSLPKAATLNPQALTTPQENGFSPLDNPKVWEEFPSIVTALEEAGQGLTKQSLQGGNGCTHLKMGVLCGQTQQLLSHLAKQGEQLAPADLIEDAKPTELLETLMDMREVSTLFSRDIWKGKPPAAASTLYQCLPEEAKAQVPDIHSRLAALRRDAQNAAQVRG